jgi:putative sigma-54 modulation protein
MELQIIARNDVAVSPAIEEYAKTRISKMARYLPTIDGGKVEISQEGPRQPERRFVVQATLNSNGMVIRAQEKADDIRTAIDRVADALTNRVSRYKGKRFEKGKDTVRTMAPAPVAGETAEPRQGRVVKTKQFTVKPMPLDEATEQMELLGHDFFLFINSDDGRASLLYRRKDGDYGLIEPNF